MPRSSRETTRQDTHPEVSSLACRDDPQAWPRESLEHVLCQSCPIPWWLRHPGRQRRPLCFDIFSGDILREWRQFDVVITAGAGLAGGGERLPDEESQNLAELEQFIGRPIKLQAEALYNREQYDVVLI